MPTVQTELHALRNELSTLEARRARLLSELDELAADSDKVRFAVQVLERIADVESDSPTQPKRRGQRGDTMRLALHALAQIGEPTEVARVVDVMRDNGWDAQPKNAVETVRTTLARAVEDGAAQRAGYGLYAIAGQGSTADDAADESATHGRGPESGTPSSAVTSDTSLSVSPEDSQLTADDF